MTFIGCTIQQPVLYLQALSSTPLQVLPELRGEAVACQWNGHNRITTPGHGLDATYPCRKGLQYFVLQGNQAVKTSSQLAGLPSTQDTMTQRYYPENMLRRTLFPSAAQHVSGGVLKASRKLKNSRVPHSSHPAGSAAWAARSSAACSAAR